MAGTGRFVRYSDFSGGNVPVAELVDALGRREVLEAVLAEVGQLDVDEAGGRRRDEHLAAVTGGGDAGGPMHVVADVALLCQQRRPGVQPDPHPDRARSERLRHRRRRSERARRRREREEERIALRVDLDATLGSAGLADHAPVLGERVGVRLGAELVQQPRRALDVGEEERDRAGRELRAHGG